MLGVHNVHNRELCMDLTAALRAFVRTIERGSITAAARDLGVSQPAVSKLLRNLEKHAGACLLERSSRAVRPTPQGLALYEASGTSLAAIDAAVEAVRRDMGEISGTLRLHGPVCLGESHLHRIVMEFQNRHPAVSVELTLENRGVDLVHENIDVAVRIGRPADQSHILRRIGLIKRILVAAPEYLATRGPIRRWQSLGQPRRDRHGRRSFASGDVGSLQRQDHDGGRGQPCPSNEQRSGPDRSFEGRSGHWSGTAPAGDQGVAVRSPRAGPPPI